MYLFSPMIHLYTNPTARQEWEKQQQSAAWLIWYSINSLLSENKVDYVTLHFMIVTMYVYN